jgi:hypothetical protein
MLTGRYDAKEIRVHEPDFEGQPCGEVRVGATLVLKLKSGVEVRKHVQPGMLVMLHVRKLRVAEPLPDCVQHIDDGDLMRVSAETCSASEGFYVSALPRPHLTRTTPGMAQFWGNSIGVPPSAESASETELLAWVGAKLADRTFTLEEVATFAEHRLVATAIRDAVVTEVSDWLSRKGPVATAEYLAAAAAKLVLPRFTTAVLAAGALGFVEVLRDAVVKTRQPADLFDLVARIKAVAP